jgi:hypothetical protein
MGKKERMNMALPTPVGGWRMAWDEIADRVWMWGEDTGMGKLIGGLKGGMGW